MKVLPGCPRPFSQTVPKDTNALCEQDSSTKGAQPNYDPQSKKQKIQKIEKLFSRPRWAAFKSVHEQKNSNRCIKHTLEPTASASTRPFSGREDSQLGELRATIAPPGRFNSGNPSRSDRHLNSKIWKITIYYNHLQILASVTRRPYPLALMCRDRALSIEKSSQTARNKAEL